LAGLTSWSFALWLYWDGSTTVQYRHPIDVGGITLYLDTTLTPGAYFAFTAPGGVNGLIMTHMPAAEWRHIIVVGDSVSVRAYVDGALVVYSPGSPFALQSDLVELGTRGISWFDGRLDEVHVFDHALTDEEIAGLASSQTSDIQRFGANLSASASGSAPLLGASICDEALKLARNDERRRGRQAGVEGH